MESIIVGVDSAFIEVGGVEVAITIHRGASETGVAGSVRSLDHDDGVRGGRRRTGSYSNSWVPSGDGAVNGGEEKSGRRAWSQGEVRGTGVGDGAGGSAVGKGLVVGVGFGNSHDQWVDGSSTVVECAQASAIVGDPPRAAGAAGKTPRIDEVGVGDGRHAGCIGYEIDLGVVLRGSKWYRGQGERCTAGQA
ncbi:MAG: hypothetical protein QOJ51_385 [Acidobacteriaceae bacterium]|nr:hypothetical protein [Acidobacteriaceae bacterium]